MTTSSAILTLWLLMDPLGNLPMFSSVLHDVAPERRRRVLVRELLLALGFLVAFLLAGRFVFVALGLETHSVRIAGGLILATIAFRMLFPSSEGVFGESSQGEPLFFPLAVPMLAGPATLSLLLMLSSSEPERTGDWFLALSAAWAGSATILAFAGPLGRALGEQALTVLQRLMGMLLTCMAIQMLVDGIRRSIESIG